MVYDQLMQTYLGVGLLAHRPTAPNVKSGVAAFYYATDTSALYVWDGSVWHTLAGGSGTLAADMDVAIASPADSEVLTYVAADDKWENKPVASGGTASDLLTYNATGPGTGIALTAATWTDLCPNQTFTVAAATPVLISVSAKVDVQNSSAYHCMTQLVIDSAGTPVTRKLGGVRPASGFCNPFSGASGQVVAGLATGVHTVKVQLQSVQAGSSYDFDPASTTNWLHIDIAQL